MSSDTSQEGYVHRCLCITEIQASIFELLTHSECTQVARASKLFYEQAMDIVWANIHSLIPLVRCMANETMVQTVTESRTVSRQGSGSREVDLSFSRELSLSDWLQFSKHAHRVKRFTDANYFRDLHDRKHSHPLGGTTYRVSPEAMNALTRFIEHHSTGRGPMFPNLVALRVTCIRQWNTVWLPKYIPLLSTRTVQSFILDFGFPSFRNAVEGFSESYNDLLADIFPALREAWPDLRSLDVVAPLNGMIGDVVEHYMEDLDEWINISSELRSFRADAPLHGYLVETLSALPNLRLLEFRGGQAPTPDYALNQLPSACFPLLTELKVTTYEPDCFMPLLHALQGSSTLLTVDLRLVYRREAEQVITPASAVFDALSHIRCMRSIRLFLQGWETDPSSFPILSDELLATLYPIRGLQSLRLQGFYNTLITDQSLGNTAAAWPNLEVFELDDIKDRDYFPVTPVVHATLSGVQSLYNGCPNLQQVRLAVKDYLPTFDNASIVPEPRNREIFVEHLVLGFEKGDQPNVEHGIDILMASAIRLMFPQLKRLTAHTCDSLNWVESVQERWAHCADMDLSDVKANMVSTMAAARGAR